MLEALDESIYWPAVAATGLASFALSLSLQVQEKLKEGTHPIRLPRGVVKRTQPLIPPGETPCRTCNGERKVTCAVCLGMGRTNYREQLVLPKGVNPVLCVECRASGRVLCGRCMGTGVKPAPIGFRI